MRYHVVVFYLLWTTVCSQRNLELGGGVNIFKFFGDLSLTMRIAPRNDSDRSWLFREPTPPIWKHGVKERTLDTKGDFHGHFRAEICEDLSRFYQAFFRDIKIEGLEKSWEALSSAWTPSIIEKKFGIPIEYQSSDYAYALIKVTHYSESSVLTRHLGVVDKVREFASRVVPGDTASVHDLIEAIGSHYVSSYVVGDSLFQVLVYERQMVQVLKEEILRDPLLIDASSHFFLAAAKYIGAIRSTSGLPSLSKWAAKVFRTEEFRVSTLLSLRTNAQLLGLVRSKLNPSALVKLHLKTYHEIFQTKDKKMWFSEVFNNHLTLYEMTA